MDYMAKWGNMKFVVSQTKIAVLQGLSTTIALKTDSNNDTSGTAQTNTLGKQLQQVSFSTTYYKAAGCNPQSELKQWGDLVGRKHALYVGMKQFGPPLLLLKQIEASDIQLSDSGEMTAVTIKFTFEEHPKTTATKSVDVVAITADGTEKAVRKTKAPAQ